MGIGSRNFTACALCTVRIRPSSGNSGTMQKLSAESQCRGESETADPLPHQARNHVNGPRGYQGLLTVFNVQERTTVRRIPPSLAVSYSHISASCSG